MSLAGHVCRARLRSGAGAVTLLLLSIAQLACSKRETGELDLPSVQPSSSSKTSADRLTPGELPPGTEKAFGLILPRGLRVERAYKNAVHARGRLRAEEVANYIRKRVLTSHVEVGAARSVFPKVRIKAGDVSKLYRIEVTRQRAETLVVVKDVTPPAVTKGLSDAERWKRAGLTPDGKPLDLKKLE